MITKQDVQDNLSQSLLGCFKISIDALEFPYSRPHCDDFIEKLTEDFEKFPCDPFSPSHRIRGMISRHNFNGCQQIMSTKASMLSDLIVPDRIKITCFGG